MRIPRVHIDEPLRPGATVLLPEQAGEHVARVLRLERGHPVILFNGDGREYDAQLAALAKRKVTETAKRVALEGMQMMGGYGYATEYDMEGHVRQTLVSTIYGGTSEIQRDIIGRTYGL